MFIISIPDGFRIPFLIIIISVILMLFYDNGKQMSNGKGTASYKKTETWKCDSYGCSLNKSVSDKFK
ncbi:hypothetical protein [Aliarcobacter butzleri]|uniref:hypothetical protein n=1 Tax=Aliarcobacter butzleri TaxID=28197 RepID=UPI00320BA267